MDNDSDPNTQNEEQTAFNNVPNELSEETLEDIFQLLKKQFKKRKNIQLIKKQLKKKSSKKKSKK